MSTTQRTEDILVGAKRNYTFDFGSWPEVKKDGETLASATVTITQTVGSGGGLTASAATTSGGKVLVTLTAADNAGGKEFAVFVKATTNNTASVLPGCVHVRVKAC